MKFKEIFTNFRFSVGFKTFISGSLIGALAFFIDSLNPLDFLSPFLNIALTGVAYEFVSYAWDVYKKSKV